MTRYLRPFAMIALCFALVASSVTMAVAKGHATALTRGGITMVLCSGLGYRTVSVDALGNPIGPLHPCPDCMAGLAAYLAPGPVFAIRPAPVAEQAQRVELSSLCFVALFYVPLARGPPALV